MTFIATRDFLLEVRKGNIAGHEITGLQCRNDAIDNVILKDIWGGDSDLVFPTAAETWEISSDSANDTIAGTGARTIGIQSLTAAGAEQTTFVNMNGTTPVAISGSHFRPRFSFIFDSGSGNTNDGEITIQVSGAGADRQFIAAGIGNSQDGHYTVPAGKSAFAIQYIPFFPKDESGNIRVTLAPATLLNGTRISASEFPFYQSGLVIPVMAPFDITEGTDVILQAKASNPVVSVTLELDLLVVDNSFLGTAPAMV